MLPAIRIPLGVPKPTPLSIVRRALAVASDRDRLMVMLAVLAGLRRAEIAVVHTDDVFEDLIGSSLRVTGKGGRTRVVPLDVELAGVLLALPPRLRVPRPDRRAPVPQLRREATRPDRRARVDRAHAPAPFRHVRLRRRP